MGLTNWNKAKKVHHSILMIGMILTVITFNMGREFLSVGIIVVSVVMMASIKRYYDMPVYDERDLSLAKDSTHKAVMWTGVFGGLGMIVISIGIGLNMWSYPDWIAPYYLTWGSIVVFSILIETGKRIGVSD